MSDEDILEKLLALNLKRAVECGVMDRSEYEFDVALSCSGCGQETLRNEPDF